MTNSDQFRAQIQGATQKKAFGLVKPKEGRTMVIYYAIKAWETSIRDQRNNTKLQAAYLYQVIKYCKHWLKQKGTKTTGSAPARKIVITRVYHEAVSELVNHPEIQRALGIYNRNKNDVVARDATPLSGLYAHERAAYDQAKAPRLAMPSHQHFRPTEARYAPSASLMHNNYSSQIQKKLFAGPNKAFEDLTLAEYMKLDALLNHEHKVLYMSQIQRLHYMADVDQGTFSKAIDGTPYHMNGSTVASDLGMGGDSPMYLYACDRYGSLFVVREGQFDRDGKKVQLNHSTLCAGRDVICAGTISIKNGDLRGITNNSGHYQPNTDALTQLLRKLRDEDGVNLNNVIVGDKSQANNTTIGAEFLRQNRGYKCRLDEPAIQALINARN